MYLKFQIDAQDPKTQARAGTLKFNGHTVTTPLFMPVGTQASVKSLSPAQLQAIGAQIILANTYHLYLRPSAQTIANLGGLHNFMRWHGPILTDSGGFQVFSLGYGIEHQVGKIANIFPAEKGGILTKTTTKRTTAPTKDRKLARIDEDGVTFKSHLDGSEHRFTPEISIQTQHLLGADIIIAFDECPSPLHDYAYNKSSLERTHRWEKISLEVHKQLESTKQLTKRSNFTYPYPHPQYLFGVLHGGEYQDLREASARYIANLDFDGFSVGGSLGKSKKDMHRILDWTVPLLDSQRPRHLLGIGDIEDLFECVERGIDLFDCVAPTRIARNGALLISPAAGGHPDNKFRLVITNLAHKESALPIDPSCTCYTCTTFTRAYLRHLFQADELLAYQLASLHNLHFILSLSRQIRESILNQSFVSFKKSWLNPSPTH